MKKHFKLIGLDCANCAAKIEQAISKLPNVTSVSVNFMTTKLSIEADREHIEHIVEEAKKIAHQVDSDIVIEKA